MYYTKIIKSKANFTFTLNNPITLRFELYFDKFYQRFFNLNKLDGH